VSMGVRRPSSWVVLGLVTKTTGCTMVHITRAEEGVYGDAVKVKFVEGIAMPSHEPGHDMASFPITALTTPVGSVDTAVAVIAARVPVIDAPEQSTIVACVIDVDSKDALLVMFIVPAPPTPTY